MRTRNTFASTFGVVALILVAMPATAADPLPDPDGKPADMTKPVQVYILLGQSHMLGSGQIGSADKPGSLEYAVQQKKWYPCLVDDAGMQHDGEIARVKNALAELDKFYPDAKKDEIAGFFLWQGDKDRYHAETCMNVGEAMGRAMVGMLQADSE